MIGKEIHHYKILEKLGEGGMGVVYKAQDTKLDRIVALKFLPTHSLGNDDDRKRFETEAKAAAALNYPNIATVYEINDHEGDTFIAMVLWNKTGILYDFRQKKALTEFAVSALFIRLWRLPESNWGHTDFQSVALPTELKRHTTIYYLNSYFCYIPIV